MKTSTKTTSQAQGEFKREMKLGAFLPPPGHHVAAWRHPLANPKGGHDLKYYRDLALTAERGKFDMIFLSDGVGIRTHYSSKEELSLWGRMVHFEPITLLSALSALTQNIGLCATASTTYNEPFHIARKFASLDHLSNGRAGWNIVTSVTDAEARNFNLEKQPDHASRYERAREFMDVVTGLWDSFEDDAFLFNKESGVYFEPEKLHILKHQGKHFRVDGPLNVARPPQGHPVLIQAGSSADGMSFAAQWAEVVFTAQQEIPKARKFYQDLKSEVAQRGRNPEQVFIMPGVFPVVADSRSEAQEKYDQLQSLVHPKVGMGLLTGLLGDIDLSGYDLDKELPPLPSTEGSTSRQQLLYEKARKEKLTLRELYLTVSGARGHHFMIGNPKDIADELEAWFLERAADGFNIMPPVLPEGLDSFVNKVVPELQRRGLFRKEYQGSTLRENLGLSRPSHRGKNYE